jgi:hypothetical protein
MGSSKWANTHSIFRETGEVLPIFALLRWTLDFREMEQIGSMTKIAVLSRDMFFSGRGPKIGMIYGMRMES